MRSELVQFEKEEAEKRLRIPEHAEEDLPLIEAKHTTPAEKVMDVVRAVENLTHTSSDVAVPPKSPGGPNSELKTTTVVMSKHTLATNPTTVSKDCFTGFCVIVAFCFCFLSRYKWDKTLPFAMLHGNTKLLIYLYFN